MSGANDKCTQGNKKRKINRRTVEKWITENDKTLDTTLWLKFEVASGDREHVSKLKCSVCKQFKDRLISMRNYNPAFVEGTANTRTSAFKEHACTEMHKRAMALYKKQHSSNICEYAPIAKALLIPSMDELTRARLKRKFDFAYLIAKEKMSFKKMKLLCDLEERHGVGIGGSYRNDHACATFVKFIALDLQQQLKKDISSANFFSVQVDASTDSGNIEEELFLILYFDPRSSDGMVNIRDKFFAVRQLSRGTGQGLYDCLKKAMAYMGVTPIEWKSKMIGLGCDGASSNLGSGCGLKGNIQKDIPWIIVSWCLAHRLELSIKDALNASFFKRIDELLLQIYYVYENSPKKCVELKEIVEDLKQCMEDTEMPTKGGVRPLRACGTRFIAHKVSALTRLVDRFGAYLSHLIALSEDRSLKSVDRQKLKGYVLRWQKSKFLLGCAFFHDLLRPVGILCKVLQEDELCIVRTVESFMKTKKALDEIKSKGFEDLVTVKKVLGRIQQEDDSSNVTYQGADLYSHTQSMSFMKSNYASWVTAVDTCLVKRLKIQEEELVILTHAVTLLATHGWERSSSPSFGHASLEAICNWFTIPLEKASIDVTLIQQEWDDMVEYAKQYLNLVQDDYKVVWWKIFNSVDAKSWHNVLGVIELLFSLPLSNGHLERVFSQLKLIKNDRRINISEDRLDQLIRIGTDGPPIDKWDSLNAINDWYKDKTRRVTASIRPSSSTSSTAQDPAAEENCQHEQLFSLDDWKEWLQISTGEEVESDEDNEITEDAYDDDIVDAAEVSDSST